MLVESNVETVKPHFDALKEKLAEFKTAAERSQKENFSISQTLASKIDSLEKNALSLGKQADEFVTALKSGNKFQGVWGEGIVRNTFTAAGLREGIDYIEQTGSRDTGIPDFIVNCGENKKILLDSKVNIECFIQASEAQNEGRPDEAQTLYKEHAKKVKIQIDNLAAKNYPENLQKKDENNLYSPFIIMAMPSEATYSAAIQSDSSLCRHANEKRVILASPQMLFGYLTLVKLALDRVSLDKNINEIFKRAKQIVDRMDCACVELEAVGATIDKAKSQYEDAVKKFNGSGGCHSVVVSARELVRLVNKQDNTTKSKLMSL
jgi:DNA recombination protein RmuC